MVTSGDLHGRDRRPAGRRRSVSRCNGRSREVLGLDRSRNGVVGTLRFRERQAARVDAPPTEATANCGSHGYRVCPVKGKATWVDVAYTPCEGDSLAKVAYADENRDGVEDALLWIKYDSYDGEEVSGTRTYLEVVDGRTGNILLHGLVAATQAKPEGGKFALTVQRPAPGRLKLRLPASSPPAVEGRLRRASPELLAPGSYVLGPNGFHRTSQE